MDHRIKSSGDEACEASSSAKLGRDKPRRENGFLFFTLPWRGRVAPKARGGVNEI